MVAVQVTDREGPPGFRGLDPDLPVTRYFRNLPHWRQAGATYYVTFRLADALPQSRVDELRRRQTEWARRRPPPTDSQHQQFLREYARLLERWLDKGHGECLFSQRNMADILANAMLYFQGKRWVTFSYVVMPNHCHALVKPFPAYALEDIVGSWKGYVAWRLNRIRDQKGQLWQDECYDRIVRDVDHLSHVVRYIGENPIRANRPSETWRRWLHPDWQAAGWRFGSD